MLLVLYTISVLGPIYDINQHEMTWDRGNGQLGIESSVHKQLLYSLPCILPTSLVTI